MKIYDCITFSNERLLYNLRLNILDKFVDKFIVIEANYTHSGNPKKIHDKFSNYLHHREFEYSNIKIKDIKSMIKNKISIYNHEVDKSQNKFDGTVKLYKLSNKYLPKYLVKNISKYKAWFN